MAEDVQYDRNIIACIDKINKICCGWRQHLCQL